MDIITRPRPGVHPGCDHRPSASPRSRPIPEKLEGADRRAWEESIFINSDLKGSRLHLVRVLLDEFCWGKCWCYPGDELLARKVGVGTATVGRALRDLAELGVIRIVKVRGRRRIVFPSHPHAGAYLASLGATDGPADHPDGPADRSDGPADQNDRRSIEGNPRAESDNHPVVVGETPPSREEPPMTLANTEGHSEAATGSLERPAPPAEAPAGDLGPLVAKATKRFSDATPARVADAVATYGRSWVETAVFGLPRLESWRGVGGACRNWQRGPDGPTEEEVKAARRSMAAARPVVYHRAPTVTESDREGAREAGRLLRALIGGAAGG